MFLNKVDITKLEDLVLSPITKQFALIPTYEELNAFTQHEISMFCHKHGMYNFPVKEQIDWIKANFSTESMIEIGSGNGILAKALGIKATDSMQQLRPEIHAYYRKLNQPIVNYGHNVLKADAVEAVLTYKPKIVLGCWVTHKSSDPASFGNFWGIDEDFILANVDTYIVIGNDASHSHKPIMKYPHKEYTFPWLISRTMKRDQNKIYVWGKVDEKENK